MKKPGRKIALLLTVILLLASVSACSGASDPTASPGGSTAPTATPSAQPTASGAPETTPPPAGGPQYGGTLRLVGPNTLEPFGLPWMMALLEQSLLVPYAETLLLEAVDGTLLPWLATEWEVDPENLEIRFKLREGVKFSDGSDFNAEVVYWQFMNAIESKCMNSAVADFEVRGEYEIVAILSSYVNSTLAHFSSHVSAVVSKENYDKNGEDYARENPVGTGPFILDEWIPSASATFVRNDNYWQEGKPYLDSVEFIAMTDVMTQVAAMQSSGSDALDVMRTTQGEQVAILTADPNILPFSTPTGPMCIAPSSIDESSPLNKLEVRQAIYYAIDREAICAARGFGVLTPAYQFFPEPYKGYIPEYDSKVFPNPYDQDKARELLAEAGYPDGFTMTMYSAPTGMDKDAVVAIQSMLEEVGIILELQFPEAGAATDLRLNGWDGLLASSIRAMPNTTSTLRLTLDPFYDYLPSVWRSIEGYEEKFTASRATTTLEAKNIQEINQMFIDNMVVIPVYNSYETWLVKSYVYDGGFGEYSMTSTIWLPWDAWISQ